MEAAKELVAYEKLVPGNEAVYVSPVFKEGCEGWPADFITDEQSRDIMRWSLWPWEWEETAKANRPLRDRLDQLQLALGPLEGEVRRIRAHIVSLVPCDNGFPVSVDELLEAIGRGSLQAETFHDGCWIPAPWWPERTTQPGQPQSMRMIDRVLRGWLAGVMPGELSGELPYARRFIERTFAWLGPREHATELKLLMLERVLLLFPFLAKEVGDYREADRECFAAGGRGPELDLAIARMAGLPEIPIHDYAKFRSNYEAITDPEKRELYRVCYRIACGICGACDCHHNALRYIESWIHGIGTGHPQVAGRVSGAERERIGRALFGYVLGLASWLSGASMHLLHLDLGHMALGFDPWNEVLRVYAYLGDPDPQKVWLAACLWYSLRFNRPAGLQRHEELLKLAGNHGLELDGWQAWPLLAAPAA